MFRVRLWLGRACECVRHSPKATMIYHNNRPLNRFAPAAPQPARFFEHAHAPSDTSSLLQRLESHLDLVGDKQREESVFTVPGRSEYVLQLVQEEGEEERFEMHTRLGEDGKLDHWERTVRETLPLRRGLRASIGQRIPRLKPALMTYETADDLAAAFSKKTRAVSTTVRRRVFGNDTVTAALSEYTVMDVETGPVAVATLTVRSENPDALRQVLSDLDIGEADCVNVETVLREAA